MKSILIVIAISFISLMHPIKMSFSKMSVSENGKVEVETRFFLDDLTLHIEDKYRLKEADFSSISANGSKALQQYIRETLNIIQSDQVFRFTITEISLSDDDLALVVEMESDKPLDTRKNYKIKNTLLFDIFKKQKNLLVIEGKEYHKFYFSIDNTMQQVEISEQ